MICEDLSEVLGVMVIWDDTADSEYGLSYSDPRLPALGSRIMLPPHLAADAAADLDAHWSTQTAYEAHRIALGVPRGGPDFVYGDTFPMKPTWISSPVSISTRAVMSDRKRSPVLITAPARAAV